MKRSTEELLEYAWLNLGEFEGIDLKKHPFAVRSRDDIESPHIHVLRLMRNPEYFPFTCKHVLNVELHPLQHIILKEYWKRPFPMTVASRGAGKSFLNGLYAMLRALFTQGSKILFVGAAFRQAKVEFEYCENLWANAPIFRDICGVSKGRNNRDNGPRRDIDRCDMVVGDSIITALPLGTGEKIRGARATHTVAVEFSTIPVQIFETVVAGFGVVSASPIQNIKNAARMRKLKEMGLWTASMEEEQRKTLRSNQIILTGTAYYDFNHFAEYYRRYKKIIESRGESSKLQELFGGEIEESFDWRDYSIIRVPIDLMPEGFMDMKSVVRNKMTMSESIFSMEYKCVFLKDSDGFYRRSLIESCVTGKPDKPISLPDVGVVEFHASLQGEPGVEHYFGVDPASEKDKFSVVIVAAHPNHRRIVYCWTTSRALLKKKIKAGVVEDQDFYGYCAKKIRELMRAFPCKRILMDSQGGGVAVREAFHDADKIPEGEMPIWEVIDDDPKKHKDTDDQPGWHILEMVNFAKADWVSEANHGMKKDFMDKVLLFPYFDPISIGEAAEQDKQLGRVVLKDGESVSLYDTLEDAVLEIEELKDELATIVHTQTGVQGRDHWDTPEIKLAGGKKGRQRKDRYSALLMASMGARQAARVLPQAEYEARGGWAHAQAKKAEAGGAAGGAMFIGPDWFLNGYYGAKTGNAGAVVRRG